MEMIDPQTPLCNTALLNLLERYQAFPTVRIGQLILSELETGEAELFLMVDKVSGEPAFMLGDDGPLTMWYASTTMDKDLIGATDHEEPVTFLPKRSPAIFRMMEKVKLPFLVLSLNGTEDIEVWVVCEKKKWRVMKAH